MSPFIPQRFDFSALLFFFGGGGGVGVLGIHHADESMRKGFVYFSSGYMCGKCACVEVIGQLAGVRSLLPSPYRSRGANSGPQM